MLLQLIYLIYLEISVGLEEQRVWISQAAHACCTSSLARQTSQGKRIARRTQKLKAWPGLVTIGCTDSSAVSTTRIPKHQLYHSFLLRSYKATTANPCGKKTARGFTDPQKKLAGHGTLTEPMEPSASSCELGQESATI